MNIDKCFFEKEEVEYLGCIISHDTIKMDPIKLSGIRDWPPPTTVKQTQSFLGFGNFYRKFISGFAHIARPLHNLTKKNKTWEWTKECQSAFDTLKEHRILNLYHHLPHLDTPHFTLLNAPSMWWCSSWALSWAPGCLFT